jgi:UDP-N-acetylmuramyl pentapeptide phosphotransferase/UDP-N-acetylglucosamine-1-phosphate transferase
VPFVASFLVLGPFLFDTLFTLLRRGLHGENVLRAHRSHLYQRLIASGLPHRQVALLYGGWTLLSTACGLLYLHPSSVARSVAIGAVAGAGVAVVLLTGFREGTRGGHGRVA